jgi:energy-coupling factor transporter ATP-binding protein EcfA2
LIKIKDFTFHYSGAEKPALKDINLEIEDGEFVLVTGPSAGGKSSLCRCINGLIPHFYGGKLAGRVEVQGLDTKEHPPKTLATKVGMIFQDPENQLVTQDVEREIAFGLENLAFPRDLIARRIEESLYTIGIADLRQRPLHELSGGEKQKVAIASVLALHPEILMLDEPTSELDPKSAEEVLSIAQRLNDELGITVILIEHRLDRVIQHADRLMVLDGGKIAVDGSTRDVLHKNYQEIADAGVGVPPIIKLAHRLEAMGVTHAETPLTVKEGRMMLQEVFQKISGELPEPDEKSTGRSVIEVEKLWHVYDDGPTALRNVNLKVNEGEFVAIMGRNASGKTTLIKHLNGLLSPTRGAVSVDGVDTRKTTVAELAKKVGFVFQNPNDHLFADTVEEEIAFPLKNLGLESGEVRSRIDEVLAMFQLEEYRKKYPRDLSGGEKQRVALASVLAIQPGILILDEPTRGMEYRLKAELMNFLHEYADRGNSVILVTHDVETVAEYAARVILLSEGSIIVDGDKREVLSRALLFSPQINRLVQAFGKYGVPEDILTVEEVLELLR